MKNTLLFLILLTLISVNAGIFLVHQDEDSTLDESHSATYSATLPIEVNDLQGAQPNQKAETSMKHLHNR